jgi:dolichol-phosphate mannosyltransferase
MQNEYPELHLLEGNKQGLGKAYIKGMKYAIDTFNSSLIIQMDADLQHDPKIIPLFINLQNFDFSLVIGSRFAPGGETQGFTLYRKILSNTGNFLVRLFSGIPRIHDCTSGFRCIRSDLINKCDFSDMSVKGYSFQSALLYELLRNGARVLEVPIVFHPRTRGESKLFARDLIEFMYNLFRIRFHKSKEFFKFGIVGASGVLVNMGLFVILTRGLEVSLELASPAAIETSIITNFILNNLWTFKARTKSDSLLKRFTRFHIVSFTAGVVNYVILLLLTYGLGFFDLLANLIGIAAATLVNYILNSRWTWKRSDEQLAG